MGTFLLHADFADHPDIISLSAASVGVWLRLVAWCNRHVRQHRTFAAEILPALFPDTRKRRRSVRELRSRGLLEVVETGAYRLCQRDELYRLGGASSLTRLPIPPKLRAAVIARDGLWCQLCGDAVEHDDIHIDHRFPFSLGGPTVLDNLQVAHSRCNIAKGARWDGGEA